MSSRGAGSRYGPRRAGPMSATAAAQYNLSAQEASSPLPAALALLRLKLNSSLCLPVTAPKMGSRRAPHLQPVGAHLQPVGGDGAPVLLTFARRRRRRKRSPGLRGANERRTTLSQLLLHLQLLQRRQLERQQRAEQRLRDLLERRWREEQKRKRWRVARTRGAARRRWRRKQQRTAAAVARSGDCLRAGLGPARGRSSCCGAGRVQRRTTRLGGGGKEGGRGACWEWLWRGMAIRWLPLQAKPWLNKT